MRKACDTMRAPGLSCRVRIGRSFRFDDDSRYRVTTVASDTSASIASCRMKVTRSCTPRRAALAFASAMRSGS